MEQDKFERLVNQLEQKAFNDPQGYQVKVLMMAALGFLVLTIAIIFALVPLLALAGLVLVVIATGGKALIVLLKLGKLLIILLIPTWVMLKSTFQMLFTRFPAPQGRVVTSKEAPKLFESIEKLRQHMHGPQIHCVLLTGDFNAAILQHPRFGLFGWEKNYLMLGLPFLQAMTESEALAVLAHEYGHLSGHHSRLGGFIYRFRITWGKLQGISEQWRDWGSRIIAKLFSWYAPYFNAYTFVFARQNEYLADSTSVELVGVQNVANALMKSHVVGQFEKNVFWPKIDRLISTNALPINNRSQFWKDAMQEQLSDEQRTQYLQIACQYQTDHFDTHPSLTDRLKAIGVEVREETAKQLLAPNVSAAELWLGSAYQTIATEVDDQWQQSVREHWTQRHRYLSERTQTLEKLKAQLHHTEDERWQLISIDQELNPEANISERLAEFLNDFPNHSQALFRRGQARLNNNDEHGVADLDKVMTLDKEAILPACEVLWRYYLNINADKAEIYRQKYIERSNYLNAIQAELSSLPADATLSMHDLSIETVERIRTLIVSDAKYISKVYLLRRILKTDANSHDYVLAFETHWWTLGDKSNKVLKRLMDKEYTVPMYIVNIKSPYYKKFKKRIKELSIPILYKN
ncbi:MAG: M48 family metalloprotease [Methylophilus sp.]|nr:M48 family metalloprotease [Methylophilus sp.]